MIKRSIARRYAQALVELPGIDLDQAIESLSILQEQVRSMPLLRDLLISPAFRLEERKKVLDRLAKASGWEPLVERFVGYLVKMERVPWLGAIIEVLQSMVDQNAGRVRVQVHSAKPLDEATLASLQGVLAAGLKKEIHLESSVDTSMLAGVSVQIGDKVIDGSLKTQIANLRSVLTQKH